MTIAICDRFPSLSPFDVRREKAAEVFLMVRRLNNHTDKEQKRQPKVNKDGKQIIRKKAGDDWF